MDELNQNLESHTFDTTQNTHLSSREREVYGILVEGNGNKTIARRLGLGETTFRNIRKNLMTKLEAGS